MINTSVVSFLSSAILFRYIIVNISFRLISCAVYHYRTTKCVILQICYENEMSGFLSFLGYFREPLKS